MADKPNILVIWGDDIGITNLSCYSDGLMGYRTPNIDRIAAEGAGSPTSTESRAAPPAGRPSSPVRTPIRTGLTKVGVPGVPTRVERRRPDHRHRLEARGVHDGPVREEPPRRQGRVPSDRSTDSTSSSATSTTSTPRRSRSTPTIRTRRTFPNFGNVSGPEESSIPGPTRTAHNGLRTPVLSLPRRMETVDDEFLVEGQRFIRDAAAADSPSSSGSTPLTCTYTPTPNRRAWDRRAAGSRPYHDTMIDHDKLVGAPSTCWTSLGSPCRQHHRHLLHRQRSSHEQLAGWRDDPIPQREELQLGRRLSSAGGDAVAGQDPGGVVLNGIVSHADWFVTFLAAAGNPTSRTTQARRRARRRQPTRCTSTGSTSLPI